MHYLEFIKLQLEHKVFYQLFFNAVCWSAAALDNIIQYADQASIRLILQLINIMSKVLQKLLTYFNGTTLSTFFVQLLPVWPVFLVNLIESVALLSVKSTRTPVSSKDGLPLWNNYKTPYYLEELSLWSKKLCITVN